MSRQAAIACVLAGLGWLALVPATALARSDDLSYGGYFRLAALPLALLALAWFLVGRVWRPESMRGRTGWAVILAGFVLACAGTTIEFWGSFLLDEPTSEQVSGTGEDAWWGSDVGWALYVLGFVCLLVGGPTAAVALRRTSRLPFWALALVCLVGIGALLGNVLREARLTAALVGLGLFGLGWIWLGVRLWRDGGRLLKRPQAS